MTPPIQYVLSVVIAFLLFYKKVFYLNHNFSSVQLFLGAFNYCSFELCRFIVPEHIYRTDLTVIPKMLGYTERPHVIISFHFFRFKIAFLLSRDVLTTPCHDLWTPLKLYDYGLFEIENYDIAHYVPYCVLCFLNTIRKGQKRLLTPSY